MPLLRGGLTTKPVRTDSSGRAIQYRKFFKIKSARPDDPVGRGLLRNDRGYEHFCSENFAFKFSNQMV
jgi:hypothetical protein